MDAFISRKRRHSSSSNELEGCQSKPMRVDESVDEDSTDVKLALLASLHPDLPYEALLEALLSHNGSVDAASEALQDKPRTTSSPRKKAHLWTNGPGYQSSISAWGMPKESGEVPADKAKRKLLTRKGKTLHLYSPEDVEGHTPCSIVHNFLSNDEADALLLELLEESPTFFKGKFKMFDKVVESPHSFSFYVDSWDEAERQKTEYVYNGGYIKDVRRTLPEMKKVSAKVQATVNAEIQRRIRDYQGGKKLKHQSPKEWKPNTAFVNCYDGGSESVGYHTDQLTYLGPRAIIGSLSLGVAREFRVRKITAREDRTPMSKSSSHLQDDPQGQIAIHLPHNSLLVMHAEMQEEWKHSIAPTQQIDPHALAKSKRINITYRCYKESLHPRFTPKCKCNIPTVLRCSQRSKENRGRYMWMCYANSNPEGEGCSYFQWAEFDDDGEPPWAQVKRDSAEDQTKVETLPQLRVISEPTAK